jgi:hypothetical protein
VAGWATLKGALNGTGTRVGYRAFVALIQDTEADLTRVLAAFLASQPSNALWRFVATPVNGNADLVATLKDVEWRAHKNADANGSPSLVIVEASGAL